LLLPWCDTVVAAVVRYRCAPLSILVEKPVQSSQGTLEGGFHRCNIHDSIHCSIRHSRVAAATSDQRFHFGGGASEPAGEIIGPVTNAPDPLPN
jgi:hypothetical protein